MCSDVVFVGVVDEYGFDEGVVWVLIVCVNFVVVCLLFGVMLVVIVVICMCLFFVFDLFGLDRFMVVLV